MYRRNVIQSVIDAVYAENYIEIGVELGKIFSFIKVDRKIAVDPVLKLKPVNKFISNFNSSEAILIEKESDKFFKQDSKLIKKSGIDVAFIDGLHTYKQSLKDVENSLKYLNEGGIILLHDCNPINAKEAAKEAHYKAPTIRDFKSWTQGWCGEVWKTILYYRSQRSDIRAFVLDTDHGIGFVMKGKPEMKIKMTKSQIEKLTYKDLKKNRKKYIGLKPLDYFDEFLDEIRN